jgi:hypothetical protein
VIARVSVGVLAGRTLRLAMPLYLATLLLALAPGLASLAGLALIAGDRPWRTELLGTDWLNLLLEVLGSTIYQGGSFGFSLMLLAGLLLLPLTAVGQLVAYSFVAGGILSRLTQDQPRQLRFWAACRHWFWPSLRLSLLGSVILMAVGTALAAAGALSRNVVGNDVPAILQLLAHAVVLGWLELARASMVRMNRRSVGAGLRLATPALLRPLILLLWVLLALPPAGLTLAVLMPPAVADPRSIFDLLLALGYGQVVAFVAAWSKVIRLAVAARLALDQKARLPAADAHELPA